ncbi:brassinosteroid-responsive RING protein 1-like [Argentina anserina]|uniref:brassinosteroid-responsive RING protein 1-like n=1 Tax=Argentina anserina TaxID=57926 RepID=UPI0021763B3E|nr:brassinosteroid-responsive RING protein 1-like [Potentilla anserina]
MGFPVGYTEVFVPNLFLHTLSLLGFIRSFVISLFQFLGIYDLLDTEAGVWPDARPQQLLPGFQTPASVLLMREFLPVIRFEDIVGEVPESCAVCLHEFDGSDEIRCLKNCKHIFHRSCLDRWMDHDQKTCPLCRTAFVPDDDREEFNNRLLAAAAAESELELHPDVYSEYGSV